MKKPVGNSKVLSIKSSPTMLISMKAAELRKNGADIISLSGGDPDFRTPDPVTDAAVRSLNAGNTHYALGTGKAALRERIAQKMTEENHIAADPDNVIVTPGAKFAIYITLQALLDPGDEVILVTPSWVSYEPMILAAGGKVVYLEVREEDGYRLTREMLSAACTEKTKILLLCTPCNPTGHVIGREEAETVAAFLEETGVYCIADEIYERLSFSEKTFSIGSMEKVRDQVITIMGFSKGYAMTGWRLGWISVPAELKKYIMTLYSHSVTCTPAFIQDAALHAFDCYTEIENMRRTCEMRARHFADMLNEIDGVTAAYPDGAFYIWARFAKNDMNADDTCDHLLEKAQVTGVPGSAFGETENRHIRFLIARPEEELAEASIRIRKAMDTIN